MPRAGAVSTVWDGTGVLLPWSERCIHATYDHNENQLGICASYRFHLASSKPRRVAMLAPHLSVLAFRVRQNMVDVPISTTDGAATSKPQARTLGDQCLD